MSATNRGAERNAYDFYATPTSCVHNFLDNFGLPEGNILEPSAGNGSIVREIRERDSDRHITSFEIREEEKENLKEISDEVIIGDFLNWKTENTYKIIIGNPPYSIAQEFMEKCFEIADEDTVIIMLLRTAFLESKKRIGFWKKHPLNSLYTLSQRPSFTGKGTDATSYSWFVWRNSDQKEIKPI